MARRSRASYAAHPLPRRMTRGGWVLFAVILVLFAVAWTVMFRLYDGQGGTSVQGGLAVDPKPDVPAVGVLLTPTDFDPGTNLLTVRMDLFGTGTDLVSDVDGSLLNDVVVTVMSSSGLQEFTFAQGRQLGTAEVKVGTDGQVALYPFDRYESEVTIYADAVVRGTGNSILDKIALPIGARAQGGVDGWDTTITVETELADAVNPTFALDRSMTTQVFAVFLLFMMLVLTLLALWVAVLTYSNRRRIEVDLLGWFAGLLFALPFLRDTLPSAPPIGAAVDIYVFLWVLLIALAAAVLVAIGWISQNRAELLEERAEREAAEGRDRAGGQEPDGAHPDQVIDLNAASEGSGASGQPVVASAGSAPAPPPSS